MKGVIIICCLLVLFGVCLAPPPGGRHPRPGHPRRPGDPRPPGPPRPPGDPRPPHPLARKPPMDSCHKVMFACKVEEDDVEIKSPGDACEGDNNECTLLFFTVEKDGKTYKFYKCSADTVTGREGEHEDKCLPKPDRSSRRRDHHRDVHEDDTDDEEEGEDEGNPGGEEPFVPPPPIFSAVNKIFCEKPRWYMEACRIEYNDVDPVEVEKEAECGHNGECIAEAAGIYRYDDRPVTASFCQNCDSSEEDADRHQGKGDRRGDGDRHQGKGDREGDGNRGKGKGDRDQDGDTEERGEEGQAEGNTGQGDGQGNIDPGKGIINPGSAGQPLANEGGNVDAENQNENQDAEGDDEDDTTVDEGDHDNKRKPPMSICHKARYACKVEEDGVVKKNSLDACPGDTNECTEVFSTEEKDGKTYTFYKCSADTEDDSMDHDRKCLPRRDRDTEQRRRDGQRGNGEEKEKEEETEAEGNTETEGDNEDTEEEPEEFTPPPATDTEAEDILCEEPRWYMEACRIEYNDIDPVEVEKEAECGHNGECIAEAAGIYRYDDRPVTASFCQNCDSSEEDSDSLKAEGHRHGDRHRDKGDSDSDDDKEEQGNGKGKGEEKAKGPRNGRNGGDPLANVEGTADNQGQQVDETEDVDETVQEGEEDCETESDSSSVSSSASTDSASSDSASTSVTKCKGKANPQK